MNKKKRRPIVLAILLFIASMNFIRLKGNENIRAVQYLSLLAIGALAGLLLHEIFTMIRAKNKSVD